jgi:hypothetical protein
VTIEEIDDVDMPLASVPIRPAQIIEVPEPPSSKPATAAASSAFPPSTTPGPSQSSSIRASVSAKTSAPKEPSKLRFSYQPDVKLGDAAKAVPQEEKAEKQEPKDTALAMAVDDLPTFTFMVSGTALVAAPQHVAARDAAKIASLASLPTFDFTSKPNTNTSAGAEAGKSMPLPAKTQADTETWTCSLCMLKNPASAVDKCTICEAPRPAQEKKKTTATVVGFDWAAAGMKLPPKPAGGTWSCSTCMLSNPASAVDKCTICETPR